METLQSTHPTKTGAQAYAAFKDAVFRPERERIKLGEPQHSSRQVGNDLLQLHILSILTSNHVGQKRGITNKNLRQILNAIEGIPVFPLPDSVPPDDPARGFLFHLRDSRAIRQAVNEMRKKGIPICSQSSSGYWFPASYRESVITTDELDNRARDILFTKGRMIQGAVAFFGNQEVMVLPLPEPEAEAA